MDIVSGVYVIRNRENGKIYIGSSVNIKDRWIRHRYQLNKGTHHNRYLNSAWNKHGASAFEFEIIEHCEFEVLKDREQFWIDTLNVTDESIGYNLSKDTYRVGKGHKHSPETLAKMSKSQTGRKHSEATKRLLSEQRIGLHATIEARRKMSEARRGRSVPEATKTLMSIAASKRSKETEAKRHFARRRKYIMTSPSGEQFEILGLVEFCEQHGLSVSNLCTVASGRLKHSQGWKCRKVE